LHEWEANPPIGSPKLTLVTRGSAAQIREEHFGFRTLLDDDLSASNAFGAISTPSAIIIDRAGNAVSPMARGIREVRDLLRMDSEVNSTTHLSHQSAAPRRVVVDPATQLGA
jgi:hypothetical protein